MPIALPVALDFTLELAILAVVGLLLIVAASSLAGLTQRWFGSAPWPLSIVGPGAAVAFTRAVYDGIRWAGASADGLAQVITAPFQALWSWAWYATEAVTATAGAVWRLRWQVLPATVTTLVNWTLALLGQEQRLRAAADQVVAQYAQALTAQAEAYARSLDLQALDYARALMGAEAAARTAADQLLGGYAQTLAAGAEQYAQALDRQLLGWTQQALGDVLRDLAAGDLAAQDYARGIGIAAEDYARGLTGEAEAYARQLAGAGAAAAAAATAAVGARVTQLEDSPCQQFCGPLGELGQLLQGLEDAGLVAILLALLDEARQHPDQVTSALDATIGQASRAIGHQLQLGIPS